MLSLFIDCCTERGVVAFVQDGVILYMGGLPVGAHNSRHLLPKVEEGFSSVDFTPDDLDFIGVGVGPGSYTGIRVGATVAKSLSFSCETPLIGVCTLKGFLPHRDTSFAALIDAKMAGAYVLKGCKDGEVVTYLSEPTTIAAEVLPEYLFDVEMVIGPALESVQKKVVAASGGEDTWVWRETAIDPLAMTALAVEKFQNEEYSLDGSLELLYLRD